MTQAAMVLSEEQTRSFGSMIRAMARRMILDRTEAEDAAQQAWLAVLEGLPRFRGRSSLSTWIYSVASRVILRHAAGERTHSTRFIRAYLRADEPGLAAPDIQAPDHRTWVKRMCDRCLTGILHCLDDTDRLVYVLSDVVEVEGAEIAAITGLPRTAVRQRVVRIRRKLRRFLEGECVLFNPHGSCACRMRRAVEEIDLPAEYARMCREVGRLGFFRISDRILAP
jgi:RNA polymerase sigma-70 factor (ECF subfamily)